MVWKNDVTVGAVSSSCSTTILSFILIRCEQTTLKCVVRFEVQSAEAYRFLHSLMWARMTRIGAAPEARIASHFPSVLWRRVLSVSVTAVSLASTAQGTKRNGRGVLTA